MKVTPKTDKQISEANLMPGGIYDFEIGTATDEVSKSGNEMIKVDLTVFDAQGNKRFIFDYLLDAVAFKIKHAAEACGLLDKYEAGLIVAEDFIGKSGKVKIKIQKDKTGQYADKNVVADYVVDKDPKETKSVTKELDDSIPF